MKIQARRQNNTQIKLNSKSKRYNTAKQNYPSLVAFYDSRPGNEVNLFYNAPKPTHGAGHSVDRMVSQFATTVSVNPNN